MGRTHASYGLPPPEFRKSERSKQAKMTINKTLPALMISNARAKQGVENAELIVKPTVFSGTLQEPDNIPRLSIPIRLLVSDSLDAARDLLATIHQTNCAKRPKVTILNMASSLRPGGGFLEGASSQEESLCMRSTLYPSLREEFYRLPEIGGIYSPDVLVFRGADDRDLPKQNRFFCDIITAGMIKYPELVNTEDESEANFRGSYANPQDRDLMLEKMRAVMRIMRQKQAGKVVLGAWGCGTYGNPVAEIAKGWQRVLLGGRGRRGGITETWDGMEIVFAIKDRKLAEEFARQFGHGLQVEHSEKRSRQNNDRIEEEDKTQEKELELKILEREDQLAQARFSLLRARLELGLQDLKNQLAEIQAEKSIGIDC